LEFKNIILEEKLSKKLKNGNESFSGVRVFIVLGLVACMSLNHEVQGFTALRGRNFSWPFFDFIEQFFFRNDVFKLQEVFSELEIRVFLENGIGSFQIFLILQIWDKPEVLDSKNSFEN
jgi:hypothetical protein